MRWWWWQWQWCYLVCEMVNLGDQPWPALHLPEKHFGHQSIFFGWRGGGFEEEFIFTSQLCHFMLIWFFLKSVWGFARKRYIGRILWCKSLRKSVLRFVLLSQIQTCFGQKCIDFNEGLAWKVLLGMLVSGVLDVVLCCVVLYVGVRCLGCR